MEALMDKKWIIEYENSTRGGYHEWYALIDDRGEVHCKCTREPFAQWLCDLLNQQEKP